MENKFKFTYQIGQKISFYTKDALYYSSDSRIMRMGDVFLSQEVRNDFTINLDPNVTNRMGEGEVIPLCDFIVEKPSHIDN